MRKAAEHFVTRFSQTAPQAKPWSFPTLDCGGDFLSDLGTRPETDVILKRSRLLPTRKILADLVLRKSGIL